MGKFRHKPPEYYSASDFEKMQWACGIPSRYWSVSPASIRPVSIQYEHDKGVERISAALQSEYLKERIAEPDLLRGNRFVCITSSPTDEYAMAAGCLLATTIIEAGWPNSPVKVRMVDAQDHEAAVLRKEEEFFSVTPEFLAIYNLNENTSRERLSLVRDLLLSLEGIYRIVIAASENPLEFARGHLHMEPQEVYHFEGKSRKVISR
jgi:hypothetical protein